MARGDPDPTPRERARRGAGAAGSPRAGITGTDSTGAAAAKAAPAPQSPVVGMGQPRERAPSGTRLLRTLKASPAAAPCLRYRHCGQERDLPRMPAVPPASLLRWFSLNPEKEGPPLLSSHPRPLHLGAGSRLSPVALFSAHFGSSGARFPARERAGCRGCFSFLFSFPLSRLLPSLEKGLRAGIGGYELHGRVISGEKELKKQCWARIPT